MVPFHALRQAVQGRLVARLAEGVELLEELCANDHAARRHSTADLVSALRRFHELGYDSTPPAAPGSAGHAVAFRMQRLADDPHPLARTLCGVLIVVAFAVATSHSSLFLLPA